MLLGDLLHGIEHRVVRGTLDTEVRDISYDSRAVEAGDLFVALTSTTNDGHLYVGQAYERGVRLFLCEREPEGLDALADVTLVLVEDTLAALAPIAATWYDRPAAALTVVALTGTKGKTSTAFLLGPILEDAGIAVGLIGSNGVFFGDEWIKLPNTTPDALVLNHMLRRMVDAGVTHCVMEATSQGFYRHRTDGLRFAVGVFSNIGEDHVSATEHPTFEHYLASKKQIFAQSEVVFVNADDPRYDLIVAGEDESRIVRYSSEGHEADYRATDIATELRGSVMTLDFVAHTPTWRRELAVAIPGRFNVSNALAAICVADRLGIGPEAIASGLARAQIKGRMEVLDVPESAGFAVLIDFAHNRLSIEALMATAREYEPQRILTVFGLEGERAHVRRFDCGEVLGREADVIVIADASPRRDDAEQIVADIAEGVRRGGGTSRTIRDRATAIGVILDEARPGDLVLLVGKGDVPYEEVNGVNTPFNERDVVARYFEERSAADGD